MWWKLFFSSKYSKLSFWSIHWMTDPESSFRQSNCWNPNQPPCLQEMALSIWCQTLNLAIDDQTVKTPISPPVYQIWPSASDRQSPNQLIDIHTVETPISPSVYQKWPSASEWQPPNPGIDDQSGKTTNQPPCIPDMALIARMTAAESRYRWSNC